MNAGWTTEDNMCHNCLDANTIQKGKNEILCLFITITCKLSNEEGLRKSNP